VPAEKQRWNGKIFWSLDEAGNYHNEFEVSIERARACEENAFGNGLQICFEPDNTIHK